MPKVHMILQGKGGVGKSLIAALFAQYKLGKGHDLLCIDTDPVNATFSGFKALNVRKLPLLVGDEIDTMKFDDLMDWIAESKRDVIIDNGAAVFVPLAHYLITNEVPSLLTEIGRELVVHSVITGGQALTSTVSGFSQLVQQFPEEGKFVVWLNPYWGPVEHEGKPFETWKAYTAAKDRIAAIIALPTLKAETYGRNLRTMLQANLTFDEALAMESLSMMTRQRLKIARTQIFNQMELADDVL